MMKLWLKTNVGGEWHEIISDKICLNMDVGIKILN